MISGDSTDHRLRMVSGITHASHLSMAPVAAQTMGINSGHFYVLEYILIFPLGGFSLGSLNQNLGWGPILVSLQVPELTIQEFLQECLALGSCLTLYVYLLQCLNREQTLRNEMKVLLILNKWLEQVYPRYACPLPYLGFPVYISINSRTQNPGMHKSQASFRGVHMLGRLLVS